MSKQTSTHSQSDDTITEHEILAEISTDLPHYHRVVIFAPHPDDEVFGAGGTLQRLGSFGAKIHQIIITSGDSVSDSSIAAIRRAESIAAAQCLGLPTPTFWNVSDRTVGSADSLFDDIQNYLTVHQPDAIFVPGFDEVHPDHRATTQWVDAVLQSTKLSCDVIFYEISRPLAHPNWFVDISTTQKKQAMACFESQLAVEPYADRIYGLNAYRSYHLGATGQIAEAFLKVSSHSIRLNQSESLDKDWNARLLRLEHQVIIQNLEVIIHNLKADHQHLEQQHDAATNEVRRLTAALAEIQNSSSWRITRPLRLLKSKLNARVQVLRRVMHLYQNLGGITRIVPSAYRVLRREGIRIFWWRVKNQLKSRQVENQSQHVSSSAARPRIIRHYLDPQWTPRTVDSSAQTPEVAIHLHLFHQEQDSLWATYLDNIKCPFDLFISISEANASAKEHIRKYFQSALEQVGDVYVQCVPNRGRDLAPLLITFSETLKNYPLIGHFHTKASPHNPALESWRNNIVELLLGLPDTGQSVPAQILELLQRDASFVYPEAPRAILEDQLGWGSNWQLAQDFCTRYKLCDLSPFHCVEFPRGRMFWARTDSILPLLNLSLDFNDFSAEPIPADGTLVHAIERLLLIIADQSDGQLIRLHRGDSSSEKPYFESALDFSHLPPSDVRALAFYLPQFHPIPENDLWHGEGFTEWTKVRASKPLFSEHYQQHQPHPDIGYYTLTSPEPLQIQAEMLRNAGLAGMVFYHYWFGGKLILEQPARMLLDCPEIQMPFAFCWANENWTRRWDGNNEDVLLEQRYSIDDANAFINYLLPFFNDHRYLRVGDRPILLVYRPADLPTHVDYTAIWRARCQEAGIATPYLIGIMTRGAREPTDHGMDAGLERVLHDWGGGSIPEIKDTVDAYETLNGSILDYDAVASHYESHSPQSETNVFRSIVPQWDNTPRYGNRANVVHRSTPNRYEQWLRHIVHETRERFTGDEQLVFINAWNEWAEGAHLEPDTYHGYAYLNATGRALQAPQQGLFPQRQVSRHAVIQISQSVKEAFQDQWLQIQTALLTLQQEGWIFYADVSPTDFESPDQAPQSSWCLQFRSPCLLTPDALKNLFREAAVRPETTEAIIMYSRGELPNFGQDGQINRHQAHNAAILLMPPTYWNEGVGAIRAITGTPAFPLDRNQQHGDDVTLVIRFHNEGSLDLLAEALTSVSAQNGVCASPLIALQRPTAEIQSAIESIISEITWKHGVSPAIEIFRESGEDLRSLMLNQAFQSVTTRYVGFLDHDDLLLPHACRWRIDRLNKTGAAVTFGRIYNTESDLSHRRLQKRQKLFEYNTNYSDFLTVNHAPIHSVLFDRSALTGQTLYYRSQQRYLEDYTFLLQLISEENTDWESLVLNEYVGDYRYLKDGDNTLALLSESQRQQVSQSDEYIQSSALVTRLQQHLQKGQALSTFDYPDDMQELRL